MSERVTDTNAMISGMNPVLLADTYAFVFWPHDVPWPEGTVASYVEPEGLSLIIPAQAAPAEAAAMRCITLQVNSALDGVGLTAVVSSALAQARIPANVVAAYHHDHVYVPADMAERAFAILTDLQKDAAQ
ncbi:ACT domain-containing protein [Ruegeria sp. 2205SS24-7]|uniref:ACT domain-containing protein n=1 Tax=Ruegeria discodermiae TaxID=3064389 RepID=UPI002740BE38|nr:ACT domain-containing protein [Ruegeria sp. 2205SS24-7]MDP5216085.1 ACT domain-containing protein [Ruegeria sp. 2205SS24-7]